MTKAFSVLAPIPLFPPTSKKSLDVLWAKRRGGGGAKVYQRRRRDLGRGF